MHPLVAALTAIQQGFIDRAEQLLAPILAQAPEDFEALHLMGLVCRRRNQMPEAQFFFQKSLSVNEQQPHVLNNLGITLAAMLDPAGAEVCYRRAIALNSKFPDAHYNLALLLTEAKKYEESNALLETVCELQPDRSRGFEALSIAQRHLGRYTQAFQNAQRAVAISPQVASCHYQLAQACMSLSQFAEAVASYRKTVSLNPKLDVAWIGLGNAERGCGNSEKALAAYRTAVDINPGNADAHRLYNEMIWQTGDNSNYLLSFPASLRARPNDASLRLAFANELLRINQHREAAKELQLALRVAPENATVLDAIARAQSLNGDYEAAGRFHTEAIQRDPESPLFVQNYCETLLKAKLHQNAHSISSEYLKRFPFAQGVMALHTIAQRLVGDPGFQRLANYDSIVKVKPVEPPPGYPDIETFCAELKVFLESLHTTKAHPTDQTLRGGTQTFGALFQNPSWMIQQFVMQLRKSISEYISELPQDSTHPVYGRISSSFNFSGSWSVRLSGGGYHCNHVHPEGWLSSAFYVNVPDVVATADHHQGWLKFGETHLDLGDREVIHRLVQPKAGHLALFPSYFWHGTVPFESNSPRITIAFDVIPK